MNVSMCWQWPNKLRTIGNVSFESLEISSQLRTLYNISIYLTQYSTILIKFGKIWRNLFQFLFICIGEIKMCLLELLNTSCKRVEGAERTFAQPGKLKENQGQVYNN